MRVGGCEGKQVGHLFAMRIGDAQHLSGAHPETGAGLPRDPDAGGGRGHAGSLT